MLALLASNRLFGDQAAWGLEQAPFTTALLRLARGGDQTLLDTPALSQRPLPARAMTTVLGSIYGVVCVKVRDARVHVPFVQAQAMLMLTTLTRVLPVALTAFEALQLQCGLLLLTWTTWGRVVLLRVHKTLQKQCKECRLWVA